MVGHDKETHKYENQTKQKKHNCLGFDLACQRNLLVSCSTRDITHNIMPCKKRMIRWRIQLFNNEDKYNLKIKALLVRKMYVACEINAKLRNWQNNIIFHVISRIIKLFQRNSKNLLYCIELSIWYFWWLNSIKLCLTWLLHVSLGCKIIDRAVFTSCIIDPDRDSLELVLFVHVQSKE